MNHVIEVFEASPEMVKTLTSFSAVVVCGVIAITIGRIGKAIVSAIKNMETRRKP
jgi:methanogenic corrinoid protein MtbC1